VAAGVALVLALCFPIFAYTSLTVYPQTLTATLLLFSLFILFNYVSPPCPIWCIILLGFLSGVLILVTPPLSLILCSAAALSWFLKLIDLRRVAIAVVVAALTVSPWIGRNLVVIGAPTIATNGGINLLLGNSENTRAELGTNVDISRYLSEAQDLNEVERDAYFRAAALDWMTRNPADALELYLAKFFHFFDFHEQLATKSAQSKMAPLVMFVSYYPLLLLATLTILLSVRGSSRKEFLLGIIYVASAATYAIFFTRLRFRVPFDYLVIILAAIATSRLLDRPRFRRSTSNAPSDPSCASPDGISYDLNTPSRHEEARC
jgi:4-amino-4-deoxy-L-arabinose transferase-like glycosyltransferase